MPKLYVGNDSWYGPSTYTPYTYAYHDEVLYTQNSDVGFLLSTQTDLIIDLFVQVIDCSLLYGLYVQLLVYDILVYRLDQVLSEEKVYIRSREEDG